MYVGKAGGRRKGRGERDMEMERVLCVCVCVCPSLIQKLLLPPYGEEP